MNGDVSDSRRVGAAVQGGGALGAVRGQPLRAGETRDLSSADRAVPPTWVRVLRGLRGRRGCRLSPDAGQRGRSVQDQNSIRQSIIVIRSVKCIVGRQVGRLRRPEPASGPTHADVHARMRRRFPLHAHTSRPPPCWMRWRRSRQLGSSNLVAPAVERRPCASSGP